MLRDRRIALAAPFVALAALLWGFWPWVLRPAGLAAAQAAFVVQLVQAAPAPFVAWRDRRAFRDRGAVLALFAFGLLDALQCLTYFPALTRGPISVAALTHYLGPIIVALAAPLIPGERGSRRALLAAPASLFGLLLVMGPPAEAPRITALLGTASAFMGAGCLFTMRRAAKSFSPLSVSAVHAAISAAVLLAAFRKEAIPPVGPGTIRVALGGVVLGTIATLIFVRAVKRVPAPIAATITYVEPLTAASIGALLLGDHVGGWAALGALLVVAAGVWVAFEPAPGAIESAVERPRAA